MRNGHLFFYLADEDENALSLNRDTLKIRENSLLASGSRMDVGSWQLHLKSMVMLTKEHHVAQRWIYIDNNSFEEHIFHDLLIFFGLLLACWPSGMLTLYNRVGPMDVHRNSFVNMEGVRIVWQKQKLFLALVNIYCKELQLFSYCMSTLRLSDINIGSHTIKKIKFM